MRFFHRKFEVILVILHQLKKNSNKMQFLFILDLNLSTQNRKNTPFRWNPKKTRFMQIKSVHPNDFSINVFETSGSKGSHRSGPNHRGVQMENFWTWKTTSKFRRSTEGPVSKYDFHLSGSTRLWGEFLSHVPSQKKGSCLGWKIFASSVYAEEDEKGWTIFMLPIWRRRPRC